MPEMTAQIGDKHIEFGRIKSVATIRFLLSATWKLSKKSRERVQGIFPAMQHQPQRGDNKTQTGLVVQKPFPSQWEHVLDTHSSSFVLYVAICASCSEEGVCARRGSIGTIGIAGAGGSWSGSSGAIWAW